MEEQILIIDMRATVYIRREELEEYVKRKGYSIKTFRKILVDEFGYKNGKEAVTEFTNLTTNVFNIKLAYKNQEEYQEILVLMSDILAFVKTERDSPNWATPIYGRDIVFFTPNSTDSLRATLSYQNTKANKTLYTYTISAVFRKEFINDINEKTGINELFLAI